MKTVKEPQILGYIKILVNTNYCSTRNRNITLKYNNFFFFHIAWILYGFLPYIQNELSCVLYTLQILISAI